MSRAAPNKQRGETAEAAIIEQVPELVPAPGRDDHVDAIVEETIDPRPELPTVCLPLVEQGQEVEIKSCSVVLSQGSKGRFNIRQGQHDHLVDQGELYLFAVLEPNRPVPIAMKIVAATTIDAVLDDDYSWLDLDGRETFTQVRWTRIFSRDEVNGGRSK